MCGDAPEVFHLPPEETLWLFLIDAFALIAAVAIGIATAIGARRCTGESRQK